jgi:hypothetical protein
MVEETVSSGRERSKCRPPRLTYLHNLSSYSSYQLVYIDGSGCDKRIGFRRTGWSPLGVTPIKVAQYQRESQYQILPAYTQDGILLSRVFQGSTDSAVIENYIEQLLHHCGRCPEPNSVLVMDNASTAPNGLSKCVLMLASGSCIYRHTRQTFNPIEDFFAELKTFIKRKWTVYKEDPDQGFDVFLEWCVDCVGK